jgi:hypothetical protein
MDNILIYSAAVDFCIWQRVLPLSRPNAAKEDLVDASAKRISDLPSPKSRQGCRRAAEAR